MRDGVNSNCTIYFKSVIISDDEQDITNDADNNIDKILYIDFIYNVLTTICASFFSASFISLKKYTFLK